MFGKLNHDLRHREFNADLVAKFATGGELWQGSAPPTGDYLKSMGFDLLVLAAQEYQPPARSFPGVDVIHAPNDDTTFENGGDVKAALVASKKVKNALTRGEKVLVTCWAGLNRSGIITALAHARMTVYTGPEIVKRLRAARGPFALSNEDFRNYFLEVTKPRLGKFDAA
jgi:hypothetical protein